MKITNGDLAVRGDGGTVPLTGPDRIEQNLFMWLLEPLGTDRMYPGFGSSLEDCIGLNLTSETVMELRGELIRVLGNYVAHQGKLVEEYANSGSQAMWDAWTNDDIVASVMDIIVDAEFDRLDVLVSLLTQSGMLARFGGLL